MLFDFQWRGQVRFGFFVELGRDFMILSGLIGIGSTLGGAGVFGSAVQNFFQSSPGAGGGIPGFANGTAYHPGGLMMVGERGPEILSAPRGSRVVPNHDLRQLSEAPARAHVTVGIDPRTGNLTAFVDGRAAQMVPVAANLGAAQAQTLAARSASRRVR